MAPRVVIAGGGIAGLECLLALRALAEDRAEIMLVAPDPDFVYRPQTVEEPFSREPAARWALRPLVEEQCAELVHWGLAGINTGAHELELDEGSRLAYDYAVICVGARPRPAFEGVATFGLRLDTDVVERLLLGSDGPELTLVVPPGVIWALPIYELALMAERRMREAGQVPRIKVVTPESAPLDLSGSVGSAAVADLLAARGIVVRTNAFVKPDGRGGLVLAGSGETLDPRRVVALPVLEGPAIEGLPKAGGFIAVDSHARVIGAPDVYAAGDATTFPVKQGGLGTQQADAAAEDIAARLGAPVEPKPFQPVLRGKLITGAESLNLRHELTGGHGEGRASPDYLWWPPHKVSGRYLAPWLARETLHSDPEPPPRSLDVEVALPTEWHEEPMALDPYR